MTSEYDYYPLTYPQKSIWYLEMLTPGVGIGNIAATLRMNENVDYALMNQAVNLMIQKNEGMRLRLARQGGQIMQYLADYQEYQMPSFDFSSLSREAQYAWDDRQTNIPFTLLDADLFYIAMIRISERSVGIYIRIHHLIADAWSLAAIASETVHYYYQMKNNQPVSGEDYPSYLEYVRSEQEYMQSERFTSDKAFWLNEFARAPELTSLKNKPSHRTDLQAQRKSFIIPDKMAQRLKAHCLANRTSLFALFYAALCIYINRVKESKDITIGTPVLNRSNAREKKMVGMFISTVPLRMQIDGELTFVEFTKMVDKKWFAVLKHQKYPYDCLTRDVRESHKEIERLFDIALSYQNAKIAKDDQDVPHESRWHFNEYQVESLYIHINDRDDAGEIILNYDFLTDLFYGKEIEFIHDHLIRLLWHALDNPFKLLSEYPMLSEKEKQKVLYSFNESQAGYPREATIDRLFAQQAALRPDSVALVSGQASMTYRQLDQKAGQLARILREKGIGPEVIVGLLLPRSFAMLIGILGVVKAGGAYLPIDPDYPQERIDYMLADSRAQLLLTCGDPSAELAYKGMRIDLDNLLAAAGDHTAADLVSLSRPEHLLYVIYTSGSTGKPKGVMIEHRNVVRLLFNDKFQFDFGPDDCWTLFHSYCFDFSVWEMYGALLYGGRLVLVAKEAARNTRQFLDVLQNEQVTVLNQTPAAFYNLIDTDSQANGCLRSLRTVIFGGDALKPLLLKPFRRKYPSVRLVNMYGITETTVHVTYLELTDEHLEQNLSNIGKPIPTTRVYILDKGLNPQPIGVPGELCVSGDGVGRGYLNNESLTAAKFVPNPFQPDEILYRSGDLARFFAQGDIEYLGRIDHQVKIRGHRIELGEIESEMLRFAKIKEAAVLIRDSHIGGKQLIAYYVPNGEFKVTELRTFLIRNLPDFMIPSCLIRIDQLPLNSNGKIDRDKLPLPEQGDYATSTFVAPQNDRQATIARIWQEVLELGDIGIDDNFFQIGGDSLNAMIVVTMIGQNLTFADLYNNPTIRCLDEMIAQRGADGRENSFLMKLAGTESRSNRNVVCFPYGGGNGASYLDLAAALGKLSGHYCVYTVNLPGHEPGSEQNLWPNQDIALQLADEIKSTVVGEIIFYGHCAGSALTLETALLLQRSQVMVKSVFLGASLPPANAKHLGRNFDPWKHVPDHLVLQFLGLIGLEKVRIRDEFMKTMVRAFRHDVRNFYRFFHEISDPGQSKLDAPIYCVIGEKDLLTINSRKKYRFWARYSDFVKLFVIEGASHYFIKTNAADLAQILDTID